GKHWRQLGFPPGVMEPFEAHRHSVMETGTPVTAEVLFPTSSGLRAYEYILTPVRGASGSVEAVVCNARDITHRKETEEKLQKTEGIMRAISLQAMHVQESERRCIARELHDEIGQMLSIVKVNLQQLHRANDPSAHEALLNKSIDAVGQTLQQIRRLSHDLRPSILDDLGLVAALRWFVDYRLQDTGITPHFSAESNGERLPAAIETACFRATQEAITNTLRHARAANVYVDLRQRPEELRLTIRDDGEGFDLRTVMGDALRGSHLGLLGMKERIRAAGGQIRIDAGSGQGCRIEINFHNLFIEKG
ncbi:MAG TPA: histidine kinase, partial [Smithellaceae bacterium]|nr:histidine kinase [Smithellaceae bacterium]